MREKRTRMRAAYIIVLVLGVTILKPTKGNVCDPSTQFGDGCAYQCHCADNKPCDPANGRCPENKCAIGWEGEYCQRGNVAEGKSSSALQSSTGSSRVAPLALDGDYYSCSRTTAESQPWWSVDLGKDYVLFSLQIRNTGDQWTCKSNTKGRYYKGKMTTTENNFKCQRWNSNSPHKNRYIPNPSNHNYCRNPSPDGEDPKPWCYTTDPNKRYDYCDIPVCQDKLQNFKIYMDDNLCHHYTDSVRLDSSTDITCDTPVTGKQLKIQLMATTSVLTLCDVRVKAFQYKACNTAKRYGPNCNNQCECVSDAKCDDKTGGCPADCNDHFTGPYCNIGIPTVSKKGETSTSINVEWPFIQPHDSALDAGTITRYNLVYNNTPDSTSPSALDSPSFRSQTHNQTALAPSTKYSFRISVQYTTNAGSQTGPLGPMSTFTTKSCEEYMVVPEITIVDNSTTTGSWPKRAYFRITVKVPMLRECYKQLDVFFKKGSETRYKLEGTLNGGTYTLSKNKLTAFTDYNVKAVIRSPDGKERTANTTIKTAEDTPSAPVVKEAGASLDSVSISITPPVPQYGIITKYEVLVQVGGSKSYSDLGPNELNKTFKKLAIGSTYQIEVRAFTVKGFGPWSDEIRIKTEETIPGPPRTLSAKERTTSSTVLVWAEPRFKSGVLKPYKMRCEALFSFDETVNSNLAEYSKSFDPKPELEELNITGLTPATEYNCSVAAQTSKGYGQPALLKIWTKAEKAVVPESLFVDVVTGETTDDTITVKIPTMPPSLRTGSISKLYIAVEKKVERRRRRSTVLQNSDRNLTDYKTAKDQDFPVYIAAELPSNYTGRFLIGDGETYGGYYNPPLVKGQQYDVIFGMVFTVGEESTVAYRRYGEFITVASPSGSAAAVGIFFGVLIILAIIIVPPVIIFIRRKRRNRNSETDTPEIKLHDRSTPISTLNLGNREAAIANGEKERLQPTKMGLRNLACHADRDVLLSDLSSYVKAIRGERSANGLGEYEELPKNAVKPITEAVKAINIQLNRYKNIATYDHSRVILKPIGSEKSDYINASYIDGYDKKNAYIASQGPLPKTVNDMWRMIWQERCTAVVMLTNIEERGKKKCQKYWPATGKETYGLITVQIAEEYKYTDFVKRILSVKLNEEVLTVTLFHFTAWPDHDVPKFASALLNFRLHVFKDVEYGKAPIVVHCSAGVGRTGTFIGIDNLIRQGNAEQKVNVFNCMQKMRERRPNMVQNEGQYRYIYDAVLEYFEIGTTQIQAEAFVERFSNLVKPIGGKSMCQLQKQYSILAAFTDPIEPSELALKYSSKNRSKRILPDGKSRVVLSIPVDGWNDYVNAVYATGYGEKDSYVITQMPFPETTKDIWRIVADTGISTIVMMTVIDDTYELSPVYWPNDEEGSLEFGPLVIESISTDTSSKDITVRDMRITNKTGKRDKAGRVVRLFQLQNWPEGQSTPASPDAIVKLMQMVENWQQKVTNKKIIVHCMDGASHSGVFCTAHSVIEKVKVDHEVDVFQYLRLLRSNRPQLVDTYEQYKFIHDVVLSYLQGFDIYSNFQ